MREIKIEDDRNFETIFRAVMQYQQKLISIFEQKYKSKNIRDLGRLNYIDLDRGIIKMLLPVTVKDERILYDRLIFVTMDKITNRITNSEIYHRYQHVGQRLLPERGDGGSIRQTNLFLFPKKIIGGFIKGRNTSIGKIAIIANRAGAASKACMLLGALYQRRSIRFFEATTENGKRLYNEMKEVFDVFGTMGLSLIDRALNVLNFKRTGRFKIQRQRILDEKKEENIDDLLSGNYKIITRPQFSASQRRSSADWGGGHHLFGPCGD